VCENDLFEQTVDERGVHIKHTIARSNRGAITHAYCIAQFHNGGYHVETMDRVDLDKCREAAKHKGVWDKWHSQQCIKSVERRGFKHWPKDDGGRMAAVMEHIDKNDPMVFDNVDPVEEPPQYITVSGEQAAELRLKVEDYYRDIGKGETAQAKGAAWMKELCAAMQVRKVDDLPVDRFEEAMALITGRIDKVDAANGERG